MKIQKILAQCVFALSCVILMCGCSSSPSSSDAEQGLSQQISSESGGQIKLVSFKKTDGQELEVNGIQCYKMDYEAEIEFDGNGEWLSGNALEMRFSFSTAPPDMLRTGIYGGKTVHQGDRAKIAGVLNGEKKESGWKFELGESRITSQIETSKQPALEAVQATAPSAIANNPPKTNRPKEIKDVIFADDFNANTLDTSKWVASGERVEQIEGVVRVGTDRADKGGFLESMPVNLNGNGTITIRRRAYIHRSNNTFAADMSMRFAELPWVTIHYADYSYGDIQRQGTYISTHIDSPDGAWVRLANSHDQTNMSGPFPIIWDTWFNETISFSPKTGVLQYFVNDQKIAECEVGSLPLANNQTIQFGFRAWGWFTGHEQRFDDFQVTQAPSSAL